MDLELITLDGEHNGTDPATVRDLLSSGTCFWMDLSGDDVAAAPAATLLRDVFGFHPLAIEDAEHFGQRPKVDTYPDFTLLVLYGATRGGRLVEVHCFFAPGFIVTVHHHACPELQSVAQRLQRSMSERSTVAGAPPPAAATSPSPVVVLHHIVDALIDGYFPVLAALDDRIDALEDEILRRPTEAQLGDLFDMKRSLIAMRKIVTPQRDMFATLLGARDALPGMDADAERYFRDLYDHLIRISDLVDSYRDLVSGALDTHLSTVSNRLNVVMKQLTIIATIFLPLSFLTGFFGQNFGWMVDRLTSFPVFVGVGIGVQILVVVGLVVFFRRRGWTSTDGTVAAAAPSRRPRTSAHDRWHLLGVLEPDRPSPGTAR